MSRFLFLCFSFICVLSCKDPSFIQQDDALSSELDNIETYLSQNIEQLSSQSYHKELDEVRSKIWLRNNDSIKTKLLLQLATKYKDVGLESQYVDLNNDIINMSLKNGDSIRLGQAFFNLGFYNYQNNKLDSAYTYYYNAERIYSFLGNIERAGATALSMAIVQKGVKDYIGSEASAINALKYYSSINDYRYMASSNSVLGNIAKETGRYNDAIEYQEKSLEFIKKIKGNKSLEVNSLNNIALVYVRKKEYHKAIDFYNQGLAYDSLFIKRPKTYARLLDNLAYAKFLSGEIADYPSLFEEPLKIRDSINDQSGIATSNLHLATYYHNRGFPNAANNYASIALEISKRIPYNRGVLESLELLTEVNPPKQALNFSKERIRISDSLQKEEKRFQDQFARIRYESEELEEENTKVTQRLKWSINSILGLLVLGLAGYIIIQRRIARREINHRENQQRANEEIYSLMLAQQGKLEEGKQIEKQRISEELHDSVLGRLFGIRLSLAGLNNKEGEKVVETRKKFIDELKGLGQEIRQISHDLNAATFAADRLYEEVVENLIQTQCERFELDYDFETDPNISWEAVPDTHKVHLYRIIQESLQNISKHAKASTVSVRFRKEQLHHMLTIKDDGVGMEKKKNKKGIGLKNMESRVAKIKGKLYIEGKPGQGTELVITFP